MKKSLIRLSIILLAFGLFAGAGLAAATSDQEPPPPGQAYDSGRIYGEEDSAGRLYMRRSPGMPWRQHAKPATLNQVRCGEALLTLAQQGYWIGNLDNDGTCGDNAEPAEWVTGNYLQYQKSSQP